MYLTLLCVYVGPLFLKLLQVKHSNSFTVYIEKLYIVYLRRPRLANSANLLVFFIKYSLNLFNCKNFIRFVYIKLINVIF